MAYDANDPADKKIVKDLIAAALAEAETAHDTEIQGLKDKNKQLIAEKRELSQGKGKPEDIAALEEQIETNKTAFLKLERDHKKAQTTIEELTVSRDTEASYAKDLLVDSQLTEQLITNKVAPAFMPAVKALLKPQVAVKIDDKGRAVVVGDKSLGDFVKEWSQGDQGKAFVGAPVNRGAHVPGGQRQNGEGGKSMSRLEYEAMQQQNPGSAAAFFKDGGVLTD